MTRRRLGLTIDSLSTQEVREIEESGGYIENLGARGLTRRQGGAHRRAASEREATKPEQEANASKGAAESASVIKQAESRAKAGQAVAHAEQAGPLAHEAVIGKQIAESLPQIVTVLNGPEGIHDLHTAAWDGRRADLDAQGHALDPDGPSQPRARHIVKSNR